MQQKTNLTAIVRNALRPGYAGEMLHKVVIRLQAMRRGDTVHAGASWAAEHTESLEDFACSLDADLWAEAQRFAGSLESDARQRLADVPFLMGGAGDYRLLYFLVRYAKPAVVVETGVAAGFSSASILAALRKNDRGKLYSSDFPYFRISDPEKYIGRVVPDELRSGWDLRIKGDRVNLKELARELSSISLLHYDSDKSYEGRDFALATLGPRLAQGAIVVFDDIQDNFHFRDWVSREKLRFRVFQFDGKWVGLVGL
jgi:predicted O-methyltransferase YrrM